MSRFMLCIAVVDVENIIFKLVFGFLDIFLLLLFLPIICRAHCDFFLVVYLWLLLTGLTVYMGI